MSTRGKLRRGRRRLICRLIGHDYGAWEPSPWRSAFPGSPVAVLVGGPAEEYRECQRCPWIEWRRP